jgi:integrase
MAFTRGRYLRLAELCLHGSRYADCWVVRPESRNRRRDAEHCGAIARSNAADWRKLLASIPTDTVRDLRDRALIATLTYSFARITAALKMKVEDLRPQGAGWRLRLHEKGGKHHTMPCHHTLAEAPHAYIAAAGIGEDRKGFLSRNISSDQVDVDRAWQLFRCEASRLHDEMRGS